MGLKCDPNTDGFAEAHKHTLFQGGCRIRRGRVAFPFCNIAFQAKKPLPDGYPKEIQTIGNHIRKVRMDRGLWQKDVAKLLNVTEECIGNWETNVRYPQITYWPRIIEFLGYDPEFVEGNSLAIVLKNYQRQHGLRRKFLADRIGVDESTVYWWIRGREVKYARSKRQLEEFFDREGISGVEVPFYDSARRAREVQARKRREIKD